MMIMELAGMAEYWPYEDCHINMLETPFPLTSEQIEQVVETVNPLNDNNYFSIDICRQSVL